jgi:hypothetical protein
MGKLDKVVSFRLSNEDFAWFQEQGNVNDICRKVALEQRDLGELTPETVRMMRQLLTAVKSVDKKAEKILAKLPKDNNGD